MRCIKPIGVNGKGWPCGKCMPCRIRRMTEWKIRLLAEAENWTEKSFLSLTYDDKHLPENGLLNKRDLQLFFKRLRKNYNRFFKYYAVGEYGETKDRPHYHCILFGGDSKTFNFKSYMNNDLINIWGNGNVDIGTCTADSIDYVTKYITYKDYGKKEPAFSVSSKNLGECYMWRYLDDMFEVRLQNGKKVGLPRFYTKKLELTEEEKSIHYEQYNGQSVVDLDKEELLKLPIDEFSEIVQKIDDTLRNDLIAKQKRINAIETYKTKKRGNL